MNKSRILKNLLNSNETLIMPDAYDPISAKLIEKEQFKAIQCSGYSFSIAAGYPKENDITLSENIKWTRKIVESVDIPVMLMVKMDMVILKKLRILLRNLCKLELRVLIWKIRFTMGKLKFL